MADFEGRTALITGGSRGIGAAVARTLAARGADIAINYHSNRDAAESVAKEIRALGRRAGICQADVTDAAACEAMIEAALRELGPISILVNNAGVGSVSEGQPQIAAMADDQLQRLLDAHVFVASILTAVYFILRDGVDYHDLGADYFDRSDKTRATSRLVRRLMDLGYQVELKTGRSARAPLTFSQFIAEGDLIHPGDKGTLTFTVSQPGTYRIVCEPHVAKGMVGTLVVQ